MKEISFQLTIIYVNYKSAQLIRESLDSLKDQTFKDVLIAIVENSPNDSEKIELENITKDFNKIFKFQLLFPHKNLGFAAGNNYALKKIKSQYYFLLNGDTEVKSPNTLQLMIDYMESHPNVGMLSPKMNYFDDPSKIWYAGAKVKPNSLYFSYHVGENQDDHERFNKITSTDYACGAALLVRGHVIEEIGYLEDFFFMYAEETEWNFRAKAKGYEIVYFPKALIYHKVSLPTPENRWTFQTKPFQIYLYSRNITIFTLLHYKISAILGYLFIYQIKKTATQLYLALKFKNMKIFSVQLRALYSGIKIGFRKRMNRSTQKLEEKEMIFLQSLTPVSRSIMGKKKLSLTSDFKMKKYDLAIAYRIYPKITKIPAFYPKDKLKLSEFCLKSLKESLGDLKVKMWVLLDNCPQEYEDLFLKYFDADDLELIKLDGIGNQRTFVMQLDILLKQNDADVVYLAEDDFFYQKNQFPEMVSFISNNSDVDFISPYDHSDYYNQPIHEFKYKIKVSSEKHWRTATSSTCTFMTKKSILVKTHKIFRTYEHKKNTDGPIWFSLTKYNVFRLFKFMRYCFTSRIYRNYILLAWIFNFRQILFGKKRKLWVPIPAIATHLDSPYLSPAIDWSTIFEENKID